MELQTYQKLEGYIAEHCYSRARIAKKLNKSPSWMSSILNGKINLKVNDFKDICRVMGVSCRVIEEFLPTEEETDGSQNER